MIMPDGSRAVYDYRRIWIWLCLGWAVSSADRTVTGPVVTWMIQHKIAFLSGGNPYATGGLIGGIFFAAYMLAQFPGGYAGDRHGHRSVIIISLFWAAAATLVSGLVGGLAAFIAARIATGLGEGVYYANDRVVITETTPERRRSFALGVVITGLAIGITLAIMSAPFLIALGNRVLGYNNAWRMPFFILAVITTVISFFISKDLWKTKTEKDSPARALVVLLRYAAVFFILLFGLFLISHAHALPAWGLAMLELLLALAVIAFIFFVKGRKMSGALSDPNLILLYIACIAVLWNLWFFGFWAVSIVAGHGANSFRTAALTAMFTGVAGIIGFPVGGWIADRSRAVRIGRKPVLLGFTFLQLLCTLSLAIYIQHGGTSPMVMAPILFFAGLFFSALQPAGHALVADIAQPAHRGSAFGLYNLIGEIGAVLSPVLGGTLRDHYGGWAPAIYLDCGVITISFICILFLRERLAASQS